MRAKLTPPERVKRSNLKSIRSCLRIREEVGEAMVTGEGEKRILTYSWGGKGGRGGDRRKKVEGFISLSSRFAVLKS